MKLQIEGVHRKYHSCEEDIIATIANFFNERWELIYLNAWGFEYSRDAMSIGAGLYEGDKNSFKNIEKYHGIKFNKYFVDNAKDMYVFYEKESQNGIPMIFYVDAHDIKWCPEYQKEHREHPLIIEGMKKADCLCVDPYYGQVDKLLANSLVMRDNSKIMQVCKVDGKESFDKKSIEKCAWIMKSQGLEEMRNFIMDFVSKDSLSYEIRLRNNRIDSTLLDKLTYISRRRYQFSVLLSYLFELGYGNYQEIVQDFKLLSNNWEKVCKKLLKIFCCDSWCKDRKVIEKYLLDCYYLEENLTNIILYNI